jgi:hypothetical protein
LFVHWLDDRDESLTAPTSPTAESNWWDTSNDWLFFIAPWEPLHLQELPAAGLRFSDAKHQGRSIFLFRAQPRCTNGVD